MAHLKCRLFKWAHFSISLCLQTNILHIYSGHISKSERCWEICVTLFLSRKTNIVQGFHICITVLFKIHRKRPAPAWNFIKRRSCEFCETFKKTSVTKHLRIWLREMLQKEFLCDIETYFYSIKINFCPLKYVFIWYRNIFSFN